MPTFKSNESTRETKKDILKLFPGSLTSKVIENNTFELTFEDCIKIVFHKTAIITEQNGIFTLNTDGWMTKTTKERLNNYSPVTIWQKNSIWYIGKELFYDGIQVNYKGEIVSKLLNTAKVENNTAKIKAKIKKYCDLVTKENLPFPDGGDCLYCQLTTNGESLGDSFKNTEHLLSHLKEHYLHGSILVNAMMDSGYRKEQIGFHYQLKLVDTFKRSLRKYLQKRLITVKK